MGKTCPFCFISCASVEVPVLITYLNRCFSDSEHIHSSSCVSGRATATYQDVRDQRKAFQGLLNEKLHFKEDNIGMESCFRRPAFGSQHPQCQFAPAFISSPREPTLSDLYRSTHLPTHRHIYVKYTVTSNRRKSLKSVCPCQRINSLVHEINFFFTNFLV